MTLRPYGLANSYLNDNLDKCNKISKWRRDFLIEIFLLFLSIKGRINFLQFGRFGKFNEQRYRQQFEKDFDFMEFNQQIVLTSAGKNLAIAFDPSYIPKSGKKTYGLGKYWSGCANQIKWGLEIGGIAAIDFDNNTALHLEAIQTPSKEDLASKSFNLLDWYAKIISDRAQSLLLLSKYLLADAYFSKKPFTDKIIEAGMHLISRLRDDADLNYLFFGETTGKKGRPKKYAGKINFKAIDKNYFKLIYQNDDTSLYNAIVYSKSLKRNINLVFQEIHSDKQKTSHKLYFSTDQDMDGKAIVDFYHSRYQIEFLYRDGKQHVGLNDCQARSENKLNFHFNASLTSLNIAKAVHWYSIPKQERGAFSMASIKTIYHNQLLLFKFFEAFAINPNLLKNQSIIKELIYFGSIAA